MPHDHYQHVQRGEGVTADKVFHSYSMTIVLLYRDGHHVRDFTMYLLYPNPKQRK